MKIRIIGCDWKEEFTGEEITLAVKEVGGEATCIDFNDGCTDSKWMVIASEHLTYDQCRSLWEAGDCYFASELWEGETLEDILKQLREYALYWNIVGLLDTTVKKSLGPVKPGSYIAMGYCEYQNCPSKPNSKIVAISDRKELEFKVRLLFADGQDENYLELIEEGSVDPIEIRGPNEYGDICCYQGKIHWYLTRIDGAL